MGGLKEIISVADDCKPYVYDDLGLSFVSDGSQNTGSVKPIGTGSFGPIYNQFKGNPRKAANTKLKNWVLTSCDTSRTRAQKKR